MVQNEKTKKTLARVDFIMFMSKEISKPHWTPDLTRLLQRYNVALKILKNGEQ